MEESLIESYYYFLNLIRRSVARNFNMTTGTLLIYSLIKLKSQYILSFVDIINPAPADISSIFVRCMC